MRVLILSCNTGEGHNSCSKAICEAFLSKGFVCVIKDALQFVSPTFSKIMSWGHTQMYRHVPGMFRYGYQYAEVHNGMFSEQAAIYKILASGTKQLYQFISTEKYDTIICTHVFSALMVTDVIRQYHPNFQTAFVATDYTCSPSCGESTLDVYFIPDETLKDEFALCGVPKEKLIASGIPIRKDFFTPLDKGIAKELIGIPANTHHLLIMSGSMGCGPIRQLVSLISKRLPKDCSVSVVCGTNEKLRKKLERDHRNHPHIYLYGFRKDIASLMDSANLYLTKPGGISTTEASVKKLPMIFVNSVSGCETHNMNFFVQQGSAKTADAPEKLADIALALLTDTDELQRMSESFTSAKAQSPAEVICNYFLERKAYD